MRRVIDLECVLPPGENGVARQYFGAAGHRIGEGDPELPPPPAGYGCDNYRNIFTKREGVAGQPDATKRGGKSLVQIVAEMDRDGVQISVIHRMPNDLLAKIVQAFRRAFSASLPATGATTRSMPNASNWIFRCASTPR